MKNRFVDNQPTKRFVDTYLGKHPQFTLPKVGLSREQVEKFFTNFWNSMEGAPPENLLICEESYLSDNLAQARASSKKRQNIASRYRIHQILAPSCFSGSQAGERVPSMVLYKALNLYTTWC